MSESDSRDQSDDLPAPEVVRRRRWQLPLIWLVPLVAAVIGISLLVHAWLSAGPSISISFKTAEGIDPGKTQVKFKNVVIGKVHDVALSKDRDRVEVHVKLEKQYSSFATAGSRFWVVRPRVGLGGVSGLNTLFSGAYIGADTGGKKQEKTHFKGLETPPPLTHGEPGSAFTLESDDLGSLDIGSPVYFRRIQVGRVVGYKLDPDGKSVKLHLFIDAPYDKYVRNDTHFWNASGVNVSVNAGGLKVNTESLATVIAGGIAFQVPEGQGDKHPQRAKSGKTFTLFADHEHAMKPPNGPPVRVHMRFSQSVRGLSVGAPVDFEGIALGEVTHIGVEFDPVHKRFPVNVAAVIYPHRLGRANEQFAKRIGDPYQKHPGIGLAILVKHGLRAQMRNGNLLTGQLYIALDFFPNKPHKEIDPRKTPLQVPTVPGSFDKIQQQLAHIAAKLDKVPFDKIGQHADESLKGLDKLLKQFNGKLAPEASRTLAQARKTLQSLNGSISGDSPLQQNLGQTLLQLQRAARSLRVLTDYLSRHPEALLRGKQNNPPPPVPRRPPARGSKP